MIFQYIDSIVSKIIDFRNLFTKKLVGSIKNNKLYTYSFSKILPFHIYKPFLEEPYVYKLSNKYHISNNDFTIVPLIKKVLVKNDTDELDITDIISNYDNSFELWLILLLEDLNNYTDIVITINRIIRSEELIFNIDDIRYKKLFQIYNNKV